MLIRTKLIAMNCIGASALLMVSSIAISHLNSVGDSWYDYQRDVVEKQVSVSTLRSQMGYGGAIHAFQNYVLRGDSHYEEIFYEKERQILSTLHSYQALGQLSQNEESALQQVEEMVERYSQALITAKRLWEKGKSSDEVFTKLNSIDELGNQMGYGGAIHLFKNYVLRGDQKHFAQFDTKAGHIRAAVQSYRSVGNLTPKERESLILINEMIQQYHSAILIARDLWQQGKTVQEIDRFTTVDDTQYLQALSTLTSELETATILRKDIDSQIKIDDQPYLQALDDLTKELNRKTIYQTKHLTSIIASGKTFISSIAGIAIFLLTCAGVWFALTLSKQINALVASIGKITTTGTLRLPIEVTNKDELGTLSAAVNAMVETLRRVANVAKATAIGDYSRKVDIKSEDDELGMAVNQMIENFQFTVSQASQIAQGDYSTEIVPRGESDRLGKALQRMTKNLREVSSENERERWLKTGQAELSKTLRGEQTVQELAKDTISELAMYLDAPIGAFYIVSRENTLIRVGTYAHGDDVEHPQVIGSNEGLIGEAVQRGKVTELTQIPPGYMTIRTGLGAAEPTHLLIAPIELEGKTVGAIEFASFGPFSEGKKELLSSVLESIAIAIHSTKSRERIRVLLEKTQKQNEALEIAKREVEEKAKELEQASSYKSEFLANMSHEIRTPMNGIMGMVDLILETELDTEQKHHLSIVQSSANALLTIINDILDFSKIEAGKLELDAHDFSLNHSMKHLAVLLDTQMQEKDISFIYEVDPSVPDLLIGDFVRLRQILINLVSNAIKFTDPGGGIALLVRSNEISGESVRLHFMVTDSGVGIPAKKQERIFEAFSQADTSTTRLYGGTGLGLSISSQLVKLMGGQLQVHSREGIGSCFEFTACFQVQTKEPAAPSPKGEKVLQTELPPLTILLAEDNLVNQKVATKMLEKRGHQVTVANNGKEAVNHFEQNSFDIILMDIQMPVMDGTQAVAAIREHEGIGKTPVPIIALTAHAMKGDREKYLSQGMNGYVTKPINKNKLFSTIAEAMSEEEQSSLLP